MMSMMHKTTAPTTRPIMVGMSETNEKEKLAKLRARSLLLQNSAHASMDAVHCLSL
jgi:hypothetical protein